MNVRFIHTRIIEQTHEQSDKKGISPELFVKPLFNNSGE